MSENQNHQNPFDKELQTARLILRRLKQTDDKDMFEYTSSSEVTDFLPWNPHTEIIQTQKYIMSVINEYNSNTSYAWAIELKELNKFIGVVRLFDVSFGNKRGELSYILNPAFQGKGLITEAIRLVIEFCFKELELNRIQARCTPDNIPSQKVIQKQGMSFEGVLREFWINKGIPTDAKIYAITKKDYFKKK